MTKKIITYVLIGMVLLVLSAYIALGAVIGFEVFKQCQLAQARYQQPCTESLITQLRDEQQPFRPRNDAVWVLGQLGNQQALPVLQEYYTGNMPEREPLDQMLSQYELSKAINLLSGKKNITAPVWRWLVRE